MQLGHLPGVENLKGREIFRKKTFFCRINILNQSKVSILYFIERFFKINCYSNFQAVNSDVIKLTFCGINALCFLSDICTKDVAILPEWDVFAC